MTEYVSKSFIGVYSEQDGVGIVQTSNRRLPDMLVADGNGGGAVCGDFVVADPVQSSDPDRQHECRVNKVLKGYSRRDLAAQILIETNGIPASWPEQVLAEVDSLQAVIMPGEHAGREDITGLPLVTIDGENAKDFDDAVWCEHRRVGGWRLLVAIADVSHYVRPQSAIDTEARSRGTSVYLPHMVLPMLPEVLANNLCSLRPQQLRLCHVCDMDISADGELQHFSFYEGLMRSAARLSYNGVARMMETGGSKTPAALAASLSALYQLLHARQQLRRSTTGLIEFRTVEYGMSFDRTGGTRSVFQTPRHDSHKVIEECMLLANIAAARHITDSGKPGIFRVHDVPPADKLSDFYIFLRNFGLALGKRGGQPQTRDYAELLNAADARGLQKVISTMALRSMPLAVYSSDNRGHFGLGFECYTHFTSPIRRYADLLVHRLIRGVGIGDQVQVEQLALQCSQLARRAEETEREMTRWCLCDFMSSRTGEVFAGTVSGVCSFGLFVELDDSGLDGLLHVASLPDDYYRYDPARQSLVGVRSKRKFSLAQKVLVRLTRVDMETRRVDFTLAPRGR